MATSSTDRFGGLWVVLWTRLWPARRGSGDDLWTPLWAPGITGAGHAP